MSTIERNFPQAARLFLSCINTFNAKEVISFEKLIYYCTLLSLSSLPRNEIRKKLVENSEV